MLTTTKAIVFSALKYGEADLIVKCFTQSSGLKSYLLRGVLKSKKGKIRASLFQPLTQLELVANHKDKGSLESLREAKISSHYQSLHSDTIKSLMVMFLAEMLRNSVKEEEANESLYQFLTTTLNWLDSNDAIANFHLLFLLKLTKYLGFYPDDSQIDKEVFNLLDGTFQELETNPYCLKKENLQLLKRLMGINFDDLSGIKLNQTSRSGFLLVLLDYYELHLYGFKKPKSLAVLNEIFS